MVFTFALLGGAFYLTYRPMGQGAGNTARSSVRSRMMTFNKVTLWAATMVAVLFLLFPHSINALFDSSTDGFAADMDRTTLTIEGMT